MNKSKNTTFSKLALWAKVLNKISKINLLAIIFITTLCILFLGCDDDDDDDNSNSASNNSRPESYNDTTDVISAINPQTNRLKIITEDLTITRGNTRVCYGNYYGNSIIVKARDVTVDEVTDPDVIVDMPLAAIPGSSKSRTITIKNTYVNKLTVSETSGDVEIKLLTTNTKISGAPNNQNAAIKMLDIQSPRKVLITTITEDPLNATSTNTPNNDNENSENTVIYSNIREATIKPLATNTTLDKVIIKKMYLDGPFVTLKNTTINKLQINEDSSIALLDENASIDNVTIRHDTGSGNFNAITASNVLASNVIKDSSVTNNIKPLRYIPYTLDDDGKYTFKFIPYLFDVAITAGDSVYLVSTATEIKNPDGTTDWLGNKEKNTMTKGADGVYTISGTDSNIIGYWYGYKFWIGQGKIGQWIGADAVKEDFKGALPSGYALMLPSYNFYVRERYQYQPSDRQGDKYVFNFETDFFNTKITDDAKVYVACSSNNWSKDEKWRMERFPSGNYGLVFNTAVASEFTDGSAGSCYYKFLIDDKLLGYNELKTAWHDEDKYPSAHASYTTGNFTSPHITMELIRTKAAAMVQHIIDSGVTTFIFNPNLYAGFRASYENHSKDYKVYLICENTAAADGSWQPLDSYELEYNNKTGVFKKEFAGNALTVLGGNSLYAFMGVDSMGNKYPFYYNHALEENKDDPNDDLFDDYKCFPSRYISKDSKGIDQFVAK